MTRGLENPVLGIPFDVSVTSYVILHLSNQARAQVSSKQLRVPCMLNMQFPEWVVALSTYVSSLVVTNTSAIASTVVSANGAN